MEESPILVQEHENNVVVLSLNRPKQLNAISRPLLTELRRQLDHFSKRSIGALIINSVSEKAFCSGINVSDVQDMSNREAADFFAELAATFEDISTYPCPTLAAVNGYAFGAGADLALACDLRIAGESCRIRFPGPQFGVVLGTHRLVNEAGAAIARNLALTNQLIHAEEARQYGIIHDITTVDNTLSTALDKARNLSKMSNDTIQTIRDICRYDTRSASGKTPIDYARESIEQGDFGSRFSQYVERVKQKKRK